VVLAVLAVVEALLRQEALGTRQAPHQAKATTVEHLLVLAHLIMVAVVVAALQP
jgi:hypothetical protein